MTIIVVTSQNRKISTTTEAFEDLFFFRSLEKYIIGYINTFLLEMF